MTRPATMWDSYSREFAQQAWDGDPVAANAARAVFDQQRRMARWLGDLEAVADPGFESWPCGACNSSGKRRGAPCGNCHGTGRYRTLILRMPSRPSYGDWMDKDGSALKEGLPYANHRRLW